MPPTHRRLTAMMVLALALCLGAAFNGSGCSFVPRLAEAAGDAAKDAAPVIREAAAAAAREAAAAAKEAAVEAAQRAAQTAREEAVRAMKEGATVAVEGAVAVVDRAQEKADAMAQRLREELAAKLEAERDRMAAQLQKLAADPDTPPWLAPVLLAVVALLQGGHLATTRSAEARKAQRDATTKPATADDIVRGIGTIIANVRQPPDPDA